jgi:hypothetical protein
MMLATQGYRCLVGEDLALRAPPKRPYPILEFLLQFRVLRSMRQSVQNGQFLLRLDLNEQVASRLVRLHQDQGGGLLLPAKDYCNEADRLMRFGSHGSPPALG